MAKQGAFGPGFHHVAIRVADFNKSLKFYTEGLGFRRAYGWGKDAEEAALLDMGDGNYLEVFAGGKNAPGEDLPDGAYLHLALRSANPDADFARALAAGARPTVEPKDVAIAGDTPKTFRVAFCKGPDGEILEFFHNPDL